MIVKKKRFVTGLVVLITSVAALFLWAAVAGELRSHNISGDGLDPNQTITATILGYDRYSRCEFKAEGTVDGYWDCLFNGDVFFRDGQWPLENGLDESVVPFGWVHTWMELLVILLGLAIGAVLIGVATQGEPPPSPAKRKRA